jgi:hypothetical protein
MKKLYSIEELENMMGKENVRKLFTEYLMKMLGEVKRLEDLEDHKAIMEEEELAAYKEAVFGKRKKIEPEYLEGIKASLKAMGYDSQWADEEFTETIVK